jgi:hypothetical protein
MGSSHARPVFLAVVTQMSSPRPNVGGRAASVSNIEAGGNLDLW